MADIVRDMPPLMAPMGPGGEVNIEAYQQAYDHWKSQPKGTPLSSYGRYSDQQLTEGGSPLNIGLGQAPAIVLNTATAGIAGSAEGAIDYAKTGDPTKWQQGAAGQLAFAVGLKAAGAEGVVPGKGQPWFGVGGAKPGTAGSLRGLEAKPAAATIQLADEIASCGLPSSKQSVALIETDGGPTIVAAGGPDLTAAQKLFAHENGLSIAGDAPGIHAEVKGVFAAGDQGLIPTRGVVTNKMCIDGPNNCFEQLTNMAKEGGYELRIGSDRRSFEFVKPGAK